MSKKTTMIVRSTINHTEKEALEQYVKHASKILKEHKGVLISKYILTKSITDTLESQNIMIMEFEDDTIIQALESGEKYQKLIPFRDKAFTQISISFSN